VNKIIDFKYFLCPGCEERNCECSKGKDIIVPVEIIPSERDTVDCPGNSSYVEPNGVPTYVETGENISEEDEKILEREWSDLQDLVFEQEKDEY